MRRERKLIYLDQFVYSGFALKSPSKENKELFQHLDRLGKLSLIACPWSPYHQTESKALESRIAASDEVGFGTRFKEHRLLFTHLAFGLKWRSYEAVRKAQVLGALRRWISNPQVNEDQGAVPSLADALLGDPSALPPLFNFESESTVDRTEIENWNKLKSTHARNLNQVRQRWQSEKSRDFEFWFCQEVNGHANSLLRAFKRARPEIDYYCQLTGHTDLCCTSNRDAQLVWCILRELEESGVPSADCEGEAVRFFQSKLFSSIPTVRLAAALWAGLAHEHGKGGRKKEIDGSIVNDIYAISAYLPYCNAMLVDTHCWGILCNGPAQTVVSESERSCLFKHGTIEKFNKLLQRIEAEIYSTRKL